MGIFNKYRMIEMRHRFKEVVLTLRIGMKSKNMSRPISDAPLHIAMVDGNIVHGGMCDRFKGIVSLYAYCRHVGVPFRIKYTFPFDLDDYLIPASYDWKLRSGEYTDNPLYSKVLYMKKEYLGRRLLNLRAKHQVHFYGNRDMVPSINEFFAKNGTCESVPTWGELFRELFKPTQALQQRINDTTAEIGSDYDAAVFRFQNLLGDFKEYRFKSIDDKEKQETLINRCLEAVRDLKKEIGDRPLLVTSDSMTFLRKVVEIDGVHIIPGKLAHMDNAHQDSLENKEEVYLKSFVDFYVLSGAKKIYRIGTSFMYPSEFPLYAAKVHDIPFETITI